MAATCACAIVDAFALLALLGVELLGGTFETVGLGVTVSYARVDCAPPPPPPSSAANGSAFLADLPLLLAALPAAAAPLGFASLQSGGASVQGLCLGASREKDCLACLAAAAENLTGCLLGASRRAGVWRSEGCFLAYADANNSSSAREDAFREVVLAGQDPGEGPNCFDPRRLVALARSMARRGGAAGDLGAQVDTDAVALASNNATRKKKNTVRVFPDVARGPTTVSVLAQCARPTARRGARGAWATRRGGCRRAPGPRRHARTRRRRPRLRLLPAGRDVGPVAVLDEDDMAEQSSGHGIVPLDTAEHNRSWNRGSIRSRLFAGERCGELRGEWFSSALRSHSLAGPDGHPVPVSSPCADRP